MFAAHLSKEFGRRGVPLTSVARQPAAPQRCPWQALVLQSTLQTAVRQPKPRPAATQRRPWQALVLQSTLPTVVRQPRSRPAAAHRYPLQAVVLQSTLRPAPRHLLMMWICRKTTKTCRHRFRTRFPTNKASRAKEELKNGTHHFVALVLNGCHEAAFNARHPDPGTLESHSHSTRAPHQHNEMATSFFQCALLITCKAGTMRSR